MSMQETRTPGRDDAGNDSVSGEFIDLAGERYYAIRNVDRLAPFFISIISHDDHWLFVSSTGGLSAGRVSPETALFPYITVDKIHESSIHTGSKTILRLDMNGVESTWEPFKREHSGRYAFTRSIYKNLLGNKICFEEINHDLQLAFRYTWASSDSYGFVRQCELENLSNRELSIDMIDGLQNVLPAGTPRFAQSNTSNLVDAYKWNELDENTGVASYALYSGITDRAEPCESLRANTVFCLGLEERQVLISSGQLDSYRAGKSIEKELRLRGVRGAYLVRHSLHLAANSSRHWQIVADVEKDQRDVVALQEQLASPDVVAAAIGHSIDRGSDELARIMAGADAFQAAAEENVVEHHYANVLFNVLRGGTFDDQYTVRSADFSDTIRNFNDTVFARNQDMLATLPEKLSFTELAKTVADQQDPQLERLRREYLPIFFGRRHGDPSRPWNEFAINVRDSSGERLLSYQGNWRDIFQNWEALAMSYPEYIENIVAKFVNASTMDGYNPYRITKQGIDWEVEEPDNPWSFIGYWGDHQIIYLQKFLELSRNFHPDRLHTLLREPVYSFANVPYRIKPFSALLEDPKSTVEFDHQLANLIESRISALGADGKLILNTSGEVYQVNLLEKLLLPLLSKLGNFVIDGGIWLNTQRPEWNDANNALVGQGLSMVTLYYLRRYIDFMQELLAAETRPVALSVDVATWLSETCAVFSAFRLRLDGSPVSPEQRYELFAELGKAACRFRASIYAKESFAATVEQAPAAIATLLDDALTAIDHSIGTNVRKDGLYNAYNLLQIHDDAVTADSLYPMLEGQVAVLSAGAVAPEHASDIVAALFDSDIYRPDQQSFMLYPDRQLPGFLDKNRIPLEDATAIPLLRDMLASGDERLVVRDARGACRFNADFTNVGQLNTRLDHLKDVSANEIEAAREALQNLYERVFRHQEFTGRSGGMFGFEGLGSIYWHMVSKLLLAVQENFFSALEQGSDEAVQQRLAEQYYRIRKGIGFNKTPAEYGAFPTDPYSHTPKHAGARQPGMTGQVKEEIITRFGELGIRIAAGRVDFRPRLLRAREFVDRPRPFRYLDVNNQWQQLTVPAAGLAFTWCQIPIVYRLENAHEPGLLISGDDGSGQTLPQLSLSARQSTEVFRRSGRIKQITVTLQADMLFAE